MSNPPENAPIKNDHNEPYTYVFEPEALNAIKAAELINRPLLVRGKPGSGKSQLAKAAASYLERTFIPYVVSAKTEAQNLLWSFDAVARLADAQIEGALCGDAKEKQAIREKLALKNYIKPEALWVALDWASAQKQLAVIAKRQGQNPEAEDYQSPLTRYENHQFAEKNGVVVLIDEIDKADSSLPNGLLEVLGSNRFQPEGLDQPVVLKNDPRQPKPMLIITTNDEHPLPDAFVRRCLEVKVGLETIEDGEAAQKAYLVSHAEPNFANLAALDVDDEGDKKQSVLAAVADQVLADRKAAEMQQIKPLVGQAEYFDILRGLQRLIEEKGSDDIANWISTLARFSSQKGQRNPASGADLP